MIDLHLSDIAPIPTDDAVAEAIGAVPVEPGRVPQMVTTPIDPEVSMVLLAPTWAAPDLSWPQRRRIAFDATGGRDTEEKAETPPPNPPQRGD
jgi:hypothetical protein